MRWFEDYRMEWIAECLRVFGYINRSHLKTKFGMSEQQASNDLRTFQDKRPNAMTYNNRSKRYERA